MIITKWRIHLFLLYFSLYVSDILSDSNSYNVVSHQEQRKHRLINSCSDKAYHCKNGQCIAQPFICDGIRDCEDGSDETYKQCKNISCDEQRFQCDYGACISKEYQCDGIEQCFDGSDEKSEECDKIKSRRRRKRAASETCDKPALSLDRTITYSCQTNCHLINEFVVPNLTVAFVHCKPNFYMEMDAPQLSICFGGVWQPPIPNCFKRCDKLNPRNLNLKCYRKGVSIPCDDNSLIAGSTVRPTCKELHRYADDVSPDYIQITCNQNGRWDRQLFSCVPECGRSYLEIPLPTSNSVITVRISGGVEERSGEAPWHVAIYNSKKLLICGGTIIHQYIVLSAAHCFDVNHTIDRNPKNYEVVVSKVTRDYNKRDNNYQKIHQIKEIRTSEKGYFGITNSFEADIVALILEEKIEISASALPACVDWVSLSQKRNPIENTLGKVSGWGLTGIETGSYSEKLLTTNLSFISHERCLRTVPKDFRDFVTFDKFCAVGANGSTVLQGDSGGGFLLPQLNIEKQIFYYLRGIVSIKETSLTLLAAFTDLANHYEWVLATRDEVEKRTLLSRISPAATSGESICQSHNTSNCIRLQQCHIADLLIQTTKAIFCGYDGDNADTERICCKLQDTLLTPSTTTTTTTTTLPPPPPPPTPSQVQTESSKPAHSGAARTPAEIVSSYCQMYSRYATDCVSDAPARDTRRKALPKEYPHIALIGCTSNGSNAYETCTGSLISERFVIGAAYCGTAGIGVGEWVHLGALVKSALKSETYDQIYDIERTYIHPEYNFPRRSIALYKLKTHVEFNSYIRPACLYNSNFNQITNQLRISSWGNQFISGSSSDYLLKGIITMVDDPTCSNTSGYDSNSMVCAGDKTDGEALCLFDHGSPLQVAQDNKSCVWSIYAMSYAYVTLPSSCWNVANARPYVYTKIEYYLDWIQGIVWPTTSSTQNVQDAFNAAVSTKPDKQEEVSSPTEIALSYCQRYSRYATDCVSDAPQRGTRIRALPKEYPHIALIKYTNKGSNSFNSCLGSLISERFVMTSSVCEPNILDVERKIFLGILSRLAFNTENHPYKYDIERTYIHPKHRSIALYKLKTLVEFNPYIRPACLYTSNFNQFNNQFRISNWGYYSIPGSFGTDLMKGIITVLDDQKCSSVIGYDSNSMACVGDVADGEALCLFDFGSPLQIAQDNKSCVWSIYAMSSAYTTLPSSCWNVGNALPSVYTKIEYYLEWIQRIVWPTTSQTLNVQELPNVAINPMLDTQEEVKSPREIASSYCQRYSRYATDCVSDAPLRGTRTRALPKEYPHIALIRYKSKETNSSITCVGSLISDQFVITTTYCEAYRNDLEKEVLLGILNILPFNVENHRYKYDVERTYIHPEYSNSQRSIALYKLKTLVEFNPYVRPACLYTSYFNQFYNQLRISNWGYHSIPGSYGLDLMKGTITVLDDQRCSLSVLGYDSNTMTCVGDVADGEALCLFDFGSPLQIAQDDKSCVWSIYAMSSAYTTSLPLSCWNIGNAGPYVFTKIEYYLEWIQRIVWPTTSSTVVPT